MAAERSPESREAGAARTAAKRGPVRALLFALAAAAVLTMIAALGWLYRPDNALSDALYQRTGLQCPDIVVIGIDADTVEALGPVTGLRGAMADVIDRLSADPANAPAVTNLPTAQVAQVQLGVKALNIAWKITYCHGVDLP